MTGIHNNKACIRCGACCIYFMVCDEQDKLITEPEKTCSNLEFAGKIAKCKIYDSRPKMCKDFFCSKDRPIFQNKEGQKIWNELKIVAEKLKHNY